MNELPEDVGYPEKVFKYRDWTNDNHRRILTHNEIFLSSPKLFNDPFDCRIAPNFLLLDTPEKAKQYVDYLYKKHQFDTGISNSEKKRIYQERLHELTHDIQGFQNRADKLSIEMHSDVLGILSLSCVWDNILMWAHYSSNHKGICVGFNEEKLRNSGLFGSGGKVIYDSVYPSIHPIKELNESDEDRARRYFTMTYFKAKDWEYEEEYHLMTTFPHKNVTNDERKVILSDDMYTEIVLGCEFPEEKIPELVEIARRKQIPLYQGKKVPFQFKLDRDIIFEP